MIADSVIWSTLSYHVGFFDSFQKLAMQYIYLTWAHSYGSQISKSGPYILQWQLLPLHFRRFWCSYLGSAFIFTCLLNYRWLNCGEFFSMMLSTKMRVLWKLESRKQNKQESHPACSNLTSVNYTTQMKYCGLCLIRQYKIIWIPIDSKL